MKKILFLFVLTSLFATSQVLTAIGIQVGPFSLNLTDTQIVSRAPLLDTPICYAIQNHKQLEMIVESDEQISNQETKRTIKRLRIEPFVFGVTKEGIPQIKGNVVQESLVQEVTIKYGEDEKESVGIDSGNQSSTSDNKNSNLMNFSRIHDLYVIHHSNVKAPDNLMELLKDRQIQIICHILP